MSTLLNPTIQIIEQSAEVKSYIYQMMNEFEAFVTPQTIVTVIAKDPKKLAIQYETDGKEFSPEELKKLHRINIALSEGDSKVEAEGVHEDIFTAIKMAKENLMKELVAIHDTVVSQQDRLMEINHYLQPPVVH